MSICPNPSLGQEERLYHVTNLGSFSPGASKAWGLNELSQVVGEAEESFLNPPEDPVLRRRAFVWLPADAYGLFKGLNNLGIPEGPDPFNFHSVAHDINETGKVVGQAPFEVEPNVIQQHGFLWLATSSPPPLGLLQGYNDLGAFPDEGHSNAWAINDEAPFFIVGQGTLGDNNGETAFMAFEWNSFSQVLAQLQPPMPAVKWFSAAAFDVNTPAPGKVNAVTGTIVVTSEQVVFDCPEDLSNPAAWVIGALELSTPIGYGIHEGEGLGVNTARNFVGWGTDEDAPMEDECSRRAMFWETPIVAAVDIHTEAGLPAEEESRAEAINDNREVVGRNTSQETALLWEEDAVAVWTVADLNDLIGPCNDGMPPTWTLTEAIDISNNNRIVGVGLIDGATRAYLLTPIDTCLGDLNGDGIVNGSDLLILNGSWGPCDDGDICMMDLDCDGVVGPPDQILLLGAWGPCGGGATPLGGGGWHPDIVATLAFFGFTPDEFVEWALYEAPDGVVLAFSWILYYFLGEPVI